MRWRGPRSTRRTSRTARQSRNNRLRGFDISSQNKLHRNTDS
jgi:hypothetical protein